MTAKKKPAPAKKTPASPVKAKKPAQAAQPASKPAKAKPATVVAKPKAKHIGTAKAAPKPKAPAKQGATRPTKKAMAVKPAKKAPVEVKEPDQDAETAVEHDLMGCSIREAKFIDVYLQTFRVGASYVNAGFKASNPAVAHAGGSRLLGSVRVQPYLKKRSKEMFERLSEEQDRLMLTLAHTAYGDPNELVEHRINACRYCYGVDHKYQFTPRGWEEHVAGAIAKAKEFDKEITEADVEPLGGIGFTPNREPHPDCPECFGDGRPQTVFKDTRNLSPAALALYAGTKEGKDGKEIKMHDQLKAREMLAKIQKLYDDSARVSISFDAADLEEKYANKMRDAHARQAELRKRRFGDEG